MKKKLRPFVFICCIAAVIAVGAAFGSGASLQAAGFGAASAKQVATADETAGNGSASDATDSGTEDDLVIIEVQDEETPAANVQVAEEGPSYLGLAVCFAAATAALLVAFLVLERKYGQLKQETRRLEDEITRLYSVSSGL